MRIDASVRHANHTTGNTTTMYQTNPKKTKARGMRSCIKMHHSHPQACKGRCALVLLGGVPGQPTPVGPRCRLLPPGDVQGASGQLHWA